MTTPKMNKVSKEELLREQNQISEINDLKPLKKAIDQLIENDPDFLKDIVGEEITITEEHKKVARPKSLES